MRLTTQLAIGAVLLVATAGVALRVVPGAAAMLERAGVPVSVTSLVAGKPDPGAGTGSEASGQAAPRQGGRGGPAGPPLVVAQAVAVGTVNDRIEALGTSEAKSTVSVTPLSAGNLTEVLVRSGDRVEIGQVIARLDNEAQKIAAEEGRVAVEKARDALERNRRLGNAVSIAALRQAEFELQAAELQRQSAELDLKRRDILSPAKGVVGIITANPGDYVTTSTAVAVVDDRSEILIDFWVPERLANQIAVGQSVAASAVALPARPFTGTVFAIDNRIDQASRTLRVRARLDNPEDLLRAGMSFTVQVRFPGEVYPAVNPLAVQWSSDGAFVWQVVEDVAKRVPIRIIQRNSDAVLVDAALKKGDSVVIEGVQRARDGGKVRVDGTDPAPSTRNQEISKAESRP
ncbi:efflux transporter periplasmic adaptor subunit [Xaviernesmea oryzae]|uniref:Efflux transporter periplasmic adaptor subunit n=1 Tax=Xaviernesmea oryzae TaxID=464029 RepID=A0A1Q9B024_9HYPH|nr:efflux RND transporter periplasmic adaptor subunit [Xaviernesmea oryzae]OLP61326.1 efflux transporter periplasmic adaptor subunit [Xaviernesmea oryzae]SEL55156.1 RND family efflux transporter, MFP subunit [Xaviernesmea oryzae]